MKALVLAGGTGSRLRPFSHSRPKQLIPIAGRPMLDHVLAAVRTAGVTDVGVVVGVGGGADAIRAALGDGARCGVRITYIAQPRPLGLAHAVRVARPFLADEDFLLYLGDNLLADGITDSAARFRRERPAAHLLIQKVADPRRFGVVELDAEGRALRLVEKPADPRSDLVLVGVCFFTAAVHEAVAAIRPSARGELELTDAVQWLVDRGDPVGTDEYAGYWRDVGTVADVLDGNRHMLDRVTGACAGAVDAASTIGPRVLVGAGARIAGSRIDGPAVIGPGAVVEDSHVGPYTAIGAGSRVRGCRIGDSVVLDDSRLDHVRLTGSVLGLGSSVTGAVSGAVQRLYLGDHSSVEAVR